MILVEGPDRCGKSTVAQELLKMMPRWSYRHHTKPPVDTFTYFSWFIGDSRPRVLVDRLHWSDFAYGCTYDTGLRMTAHEWRMVELSLMAVGTIVLLLTDEPSEIVERWSNAEMYPSGPIAQVVDRYDELFEQLSYPVTSHLVAHRCRLPDLIKDGKPTDLLVQIAADAEHRAARCSELMAPSIGYGPPDAEFMLIGEAPGDGRFKDKSMRPQFPFSSGRASEWLWQALDGLGLQWWKGYYTNASAFAGPNDFQEYFFRQLGSVKIVVCLGNKARDLVKESMKMMRPGTAFRPSVTAVDHPSYARRFRHGDFLKWRAELREPLKVWCNR